MSAPPRSRGAAVVTFDLWSDFICGHCYYGTRRLVDALAGLPDQTAFQLRWRSFQLDPRPAGRRPGGDLYDYLAQFNGSRDAARAAAARIGPVAAAEGIAFLPDLARPGNTADAHRLVHLAGEHGLQTELALRLYQAYWSEGLPISDHGALLEIAVQVGLDREVTRHMLAGPRFAAEVVNDQSLAADLGVRGVPAVVADGRAAFSATEPRTALTATLRRLLGERTRA
ncbi:DsbA family oxidoreductase [Actinomadura rugatobispora]|uniref:DsbA family oxidoreductase n=1 Tax=Actinomadura rugatobispora TaxID=1994 RepID=A0ABW0ZS33_9ACTN